MSENSLHTSEAIFSKTGYDSHNLNDYFHSSLKKHNNHNFKTETFLFH